MPAAVTALLCLITCPDAAIARRIAETLVDERLAACVNWIDGVQSVYRWQGTIERANEVQLLIKTSSAQFETLRARLCALHPYEVPEVLALSIERGSPAYLSWLTTQLGTPA